MVLMKLQMVLMKLQAKGDWSNKEEEAMTKKLTSRASMELDLDSILDLESSSDDDDLNNIPHRTVDEILNDSDSSSSSASSSSALPSFNRTFIRRKQPLSNPPSVNSSFLQKEESPSQDEEESEATVVTSPKASSVSRMSKPNSPETLKSSKLEDLKVSLFSRRKPSGEFSGNSFALGRNLFGGVKPNPKPGAALAAAAAASRSVPTPHAAAIKLRRETSSTLLEKAQLSEDLQANSVVVESEMGVDENEVLGLENVQLDRRNVEGEEKGTSFSSSREESVVSSHSNGEVSGGDEPVKLSKDEDLDVIGSGGDAVELFAEEDLKASNSLISTLSVESHMSDLNVDDESKILDSSNVVDESIQHNDAIENGHDMSANPELSNFASASEEWISYPSSANVEVNKVEDDSILLGSETSDFEKRMETTAKYGDASLLVEETSSKSDKTDIFEDGVVQLDRKGSKKSGKKLRSSLKPLEFAEELEKKHASFGLHWEEGAAAQPMRLEGIRRGPPAVGYLHIDPDNTISRTISSQAFRREHGSPQVLAVHVNFIAVGMSKGLVLVVPSKYSAHTADNMDSKMLLLTSQGDKSQSPVTSMCFNQQGDLLLAGYGNGHLIVWDVHRATTSKVITGEHTAPVVHAMFLGQDSQATRQFKAVTGDCKGLVLLHTSTVVPLLNRYTVKTQCLLDGQRNGTVLCASPLLVDESGSTLTSSQGNTTTTSGGIGSMMGSVVGGVLFNEGSSLVEEGVVIFVTHQIALVIRLSPSLEVYAQLSKPDGVREGSMPYTAWKYMTQWSLSTESMTGETPARAALLAIVWDRKVQVAKLVKSELKVYKEWTIDSAAIGVEWLDDQMMVILTLRGQLCLFSKEGNELHRTSFAVDGSGADDLISYHTYFINLFGNPEKAYHNCIAVRGATIYVLGPMNLVVSRLLPWKERIQVLRKAGDWMGALDMAMRLYDGHAHGVIDLPRTLDAIREMIMPYLVELILSYVDEVFSYISVAFCNQIERDEQVHELKSKGNSVHSEMEDQFARVGGVAVEFCVHITRIDILFDEIFSKFVAVQHGGTFLELLEPYILKDMLGCLPPEIMQALVEHYSSKGWLQRVEQCVLHMDISSLDFNQVVRLCREHGLYGALIYLFNRGLDDFKAPLEELLLVVRSSQREDAAVIGYRMLVYLKYCFSGLAFPPGHGTLPPTRLPSLRTELLQFLLENSNAIDSQVATSFKTPTEACPNLYVLLWLDTEATLDVLRYAFIKEESSNSEVDANTEDSKESSENTEHQNLMVQKTVDTLIHVVDMGISEEDGQTGINEVDFKEAWPSKKDIGHLLEFIAYFVTCKRATIPKTVLKHILEFLTSEIDVSLPSQNIEISKRREKQVLTLLKNVPESDWDSSYVLHLCEKAQFHKVCGLIHTIRHQYVAALNDYMKDLDEPIHAFSFVNDMLLHLSEDENAPFRSAVISRIPELVTLSREGTLFLILDHFNKESDHILSELRSHPKSLFLYLKTTIEVHLSGKLDFSSLRNDNVLEVQHKSTLKDHTSALEAYCKRISDFTKLLRHTPVNVTDEMIELYLELLCQYERNSVLKFLETFENYRVEHCLRLCQEYGVIDAAAFLLERVGDVGSALLLTISGLNEKLSMLGTAVDNMVSDISSCSFSEIHLFKTIFGISEVNAVRDILSASIGLCQRNTQRLDPEESEFLWFKLLDSFCEPLKETSDDRTTSKGNHVGIPTTTFHIEDNEALITWRITKSNQGAHILHKLFAQFIKEIVEGMIGYVHLPTIMAKLLSDNGSQEFGDFKLTIMGMLGTYGFERRILDTAKSLIEDDTFYTMSLLRKGASHGYAPQNLICCICSCPITKDSSTSGIRVFNCGHTTHIQCEFQENETLNRHASGCPVCMPKKRTRGSRDKQAFTESGLVRSYVPRQQQTQGAITVQHPNESDLVEKPYGIHQISRFEILSNLQKSQRSFQIENLPQLRLAPPAVYHEKVQKGTDVLASSSASVKNEKASKGKQLKELKAKGSSIRFPLRSSIFGNEKTRKR